MMGNAVITIGHVLIIAGMGYWHHRCCARIINERNEAQDEVRKLNSLLALSNEPDAAMGLAVRLMNGFEEMKRRNINIESLITAERSNDKKALVAGEDFCHTCKREFGETAFCEDGAGGVCRSCWATSH